MRAWWRDTALPWLLLPPSLLLAVLAVPALWTLLKGRRLLTRS